MYLEENMCLLNYFNPTENFCRYMDLTRQKFSCMLSSLSSSFLSTAKLLGPLYSCSIQKQQPLSVLSLNSVDKMPLFQYDSSASLSLNRNVCFSILLLSNVLT